MAPILNVLTTLSITCRPVLVCFGVHANGIHAEISLHQSVYFENKQIQIVSIENREAEPCLLTSSRNNALSQKQNKTSAGGTRSSFGRKGTLEIIR